MNLRYLKNFLEASWPRISVCLQAYEAVFFLHVDSPTGPFKIIQPASRSEDQGTLCYPGTPIDGLLGPKTAKRSVGSSAVEKYEKNCNMKSLNRKSWNAWERQKNRISAFIFEMSRKFTNSGRLKLYFPKVVFPYVSKYRLERPSLKIPIINVQYHIFTKFVAWWKVFFCWIFLLNHLHRWRWASFRSRNSLKCNIFSGC